MTIYSVTPFKFTTAGHCLLALLNNSDWKQSETCIMLFSTTIFYAFGAFV